MAVTTSTTAIAISSDGGRAASACSVPPAGAEVLQRGDSAVTRYHALRRRERVEAQRLGRAALGLPSASRRERKALADWRRFRMQFRLPSDTDLLRAIYRMGPPRVSADEYGVPLTVLERRDLAFRGRAGDALATVVRYGTTCAPDAYAGLWLYDTARGVRVGVRFKGDISRFGRAVARRYRFRRLLHVLPARFTLQELEALQARVDSEWDMWREQGVEIASTWQDVTGNFVGVSVRPLSKETREKLRRAYGPAVKARPYEEVDPL